MSLNTWYIEKDGFNVNYHRKYSLYCNIHKQALNYYSDKHTNINFFLSFFKSGCLGNRPKTKIVSVYSSSSMASNGSNTNNRWNVTQCWKLTVFCLNLSKQE